MCGKTQSNNLIVPSPLVSMDWNSIFNSDFSNPRGLRPFSSSLMSRLPSLVWSISSNVRRSSVGLNLSSDSRRTPGVGGAESRTNPRNRTEQKWWVGAREPTVRQSRSRRDFVRHSKEPTNEGEGGESRGEEAARHLPLPPECLDWSREKSSSASSFLHEVPTSCSVSFSFVTSPSNDT
jgi:hypothetical protein